MRLVKNILLFIVALYIGAVIFMPKSELFYFAQKQLKPKGIVVGNEEIISKIGTFELLHPVVYFQGVDIARATDVKVTPLLFLNKLEASDVELLNVAKKFLNVNISSLKANQSILKPFMVKIDATGNFGVAHGYANLKTRVVHLDIVEPKDLNSIKRYLKKGEKGWYYESSF